ncbi:MAG: prepilin-type N-terminal cleavage/methylation domain-containing protein [Sedimentisphaerales bacterium]
MMAKRKAFTLVELLIVVAIISVMTFIAVPKMGFSLISGGKAQATTQTLAGAIRHTRTLAITNAASNSYGYSFQITTNPAGFQIVNLKPPTQIVETGSIAQGVTCSAGSFGFGPFGNGLQSDSSMTVSIGSITYIISVKSNTGMVKCELQ